MSRNDSDYVLVASAAELEKAGKKTVYVGGHVVTLIAHDGEYYAIDNRCPHMGFPLDRGTVSDGILTCHWHHARFDLQSGGTFDLWTDDVRRFPVEVQNGDIWIDISQHEDPFDHQRRRLLVGLERDIPLVIGKAILTLAEEDPSLTGPFRSGLEFGCGFRAEGWGQGLTILTSLMNITPNLFSADGARASYHGLSAVARETIGSAPRFGVAPLPDEGVPIPTLRRWFRRFVEVRDAEGAERCLVSAIASGADDMQMADMLFAAATDHRYIQNGHVVDFTNKAFESLDIVGWDYAGTVLTSLARGYAEANRMEESNAWRNPVDLVSMLEAAFDRLPECRAQSKQARKDFQTTWGGRKELVQIILEDSPQDTIESMLAALREGAWGIELASAVSYAAALRIARFHTSNEFSDWDTALHTFTFANAVEQGMRRAPSAELLRGVFDAAMSVYLDRFLNIPSAPLPMSQNLSGQPEKTLQELSLLLDRQQQVDEAAKAVAVYLGGGGDVEPLLATIGALLLREDRDFHTIQAVEATIRQIKMLSDSDEIAVMIVAAVRYLAAHAPTVRAQGQTFQIAQRLHRGEELYT